MIRRRRLVTVAIVVILTITTRLVIADDYYSSLSSSSSSSSSSSASSPFSPNDDANNKNPPPPPPRSPSSSHVLDEQDSKGNSKKLKICTVSGGLDIVRFTSSNIRNIFRGALEDVEFIREYVAEAAYNQGIVGGRHDLNDLTPIIISSSNSTTNSSGYMDDRIDRRVERYVSINGNNINGNNINSDDEQQASNELALIDSVSNIFPWIVDRKSDPSKWWLPHQNGRSTSRDGRGEQRSNDLLLGDRRLYTAAWIGTRGNAWLHYPPFLVHNNNDTTTTTTAANRSSSSSGFFYYDPRHHGGAAADRFVKPNLPQNNPERKTYFTSPYYNPNTDAVSGEQSSSSSSSSSSLLLITAQTPVYLTGTNFRGTIYGHDDGNGNDDDDTNNYIGSTGIDISVASVTPLLQEQLEGTLTAGSFAFVVDCNTFDIILISQSTVEKIYPKRTGMEESRVIRRTRNSPTTTTTNDTTTTTTISDRRNQTYLVADTIFQSPLGLDNADWNSVATQVKQLKAGQRHVGTLDIILTGEEDEMPTSFYVMYDNWPDVANYTLVTFVPVHEIENAINVTAKSNSNSLSSVGGGGGGGGERGGEGISLDVYPGKTTRCSTNITNHGTLDVTLSVTKLPPWLRLVTTATTNNDDDLNGNSGSGSGDDETNNNNNNNNNMFRLPIGQTITVEYETITEDYVRIPDFGTSLIAFTVSDDHYPECFHEEVLAITVEVNTVYEEEALYLGPIRFYGYALSTIVMATSIGWSMWVYRNRKNRVVRASQPIFLYMMCAGIVMLGASMIPMSIDDSVASERGCSIACMTSPWLLTLGFSLTFSALFSKIWRINQIVKASKNYQRTDVDISTFQAMIPSLIMFTLNATILSVWTAMDPIVWKREPIGSDTRSTEYGAISPTTTRNTANEYNASTGFCNVGESPFSLTCTILILAINFSALILALIQLYRARELATEYSEGKHIAIAIGSMIQAFITGLPILVLAHRNEQAMYFMETTIVFVICMSLLLLMFLPKYYIAAAEEAMKSSATGRSSKGNEEQRDPGLRNCGGDGGGGLCMISSLSQNHNDTRPEEEEEPPELESNLDGIQDSGDHGSEHFSPPEDPHKTEPCETQLVSCVSDMSDSLFPISEYEVTLDVEGAANVARYNDFGVCRDDRSAFEFHKSLESLDGSPQLPVRRCSATEIEHISSVSMIEEFSPPPRPRKALLASLDGSSDDLPLDDCPKLPLRITSSIEHIE